MSLASLVDEEICKSEPEFLRARLQPVVSNQALHITQRHKLDPGIIGPLSEDLFPLAAKNPVERTPASNALDALARYIPIEVVTLYVAASAAMPSLKTALGVTEAGVYWFFGATTPILFLLIFAGKRRAAGLPPFPSLKLLPWWKLTASGIAFFVWALAVPTTPYLGGEAGKVVAAFAALFVSTVLTLLEPIVERPSKAKARRSISDLELRG